MFWVFLFVGRSNLMVGLYLVIGYSYITVIIDNSYICMFISGVVI